MIEQKFRAPPPSVPYWQDPRIHNFGNDSLLHALVVPFSLEQIKKYEYANKDIRDDVFKLLPKSEYPRVVDFCCGVGISTIPWGIGVDTSKAMLKAAKCRKKREPVNHLAKRFVQGNCETFGEDNSVEAVTCLLATHEMP